MELKNLIRRFSEGRENQYKAIFSTLFIAGNKLQTLFDNNIPELTLKQFMLLTMLRQAKEQLTLTQLGGLLGCSRQNIKKLADALEKKGFVKVKRGETDVRAYHIYPTEKLEQYFENVFCVYQKELNYLFEVYTGEEMDCLFRLMMKLYDGIGNLEQKLREKDAKIQELGEDKTAVQENVQW